MKPLILFDLNFASFGNSIAEVCVYGEMGSWKILGDTGKNINNRNLETYTVIVFFS